MKLCTMVQVVGQEADVITKIVVVETSIVSDDHDFGWGDDGRLHVEGSVEVAPR